MPIPCPCCKASNDTGPACRRCRADLSLLFAIEADREAAIQLARGFAAESRFPEAIAALERAAALRRGDEVARLKAAVLLLGRDFAGALNAYHEVVSRSR